MRILGIDPGIGRTGWGVIEIQNSTLRRSSGQEFKVQNYGCIETQPNSAVPGRLEALYSEIGMIIKEYHVEQLAIEELFFNTNAKTALVVGQARGVVLLAASQNNLPITVYTPLQVKMALTGYGRAEKQQIAQMVKTVLALQTIPKPDDVTDALAIAITHAFSHRNNY